MHLTDMVGSIFGRLQVVDVYRSKGGRIKCKCVCSCGSSSEVSASDLRGGKTKSCGCLRKDNMTKHGMCKTRFYSIWSNIINRCKHESSPNYKYYGGRGITVCNEWLTFENFKDDLFESYNAHVLKHGEKNTTIDRIDVDGNYELGNVTWATMQEQSVNKRIRTGNTSGHVGIGYVKRIKKWRARVTENSKEIHIGVFDTLEEAVKARENYKKEKGYI